MDESYKLLESFINDKDPNAFEKLFCMPNDELDRIIDKWKENNNG